MEAGRVFPGREAEVWVPGMRQVSPLVPVPLSGFPLLSVLVFMAAETPLVSLKQRKCLLCPLWRPEARNQNLKSKVLLGGSGTDSAARTLPASGGRRDFLACGLFLRLNMHHPDIWFRHPGPSLLRPSCLSLIRTPIITFRVHSGNPG